MRRCYNDKDKSKGPYDHNEEKDWRENSEGQGQGQIISTKKVNYTKSERQ